MGYGKKILIFCLAAAMSLPCSAYAQPESGQQAGTASDSGQTGVVQDGAEEALSESQKKKNGTFGTDYLSGEANSTLEFCYTWEGQPVENAQLFISESGKNECLYNTGLVTDVQGRTTAVFNLPGIYVIEARYPGAGAEDERNAVCTVEITGSSSDPGTLNPSAAARQIIKKAEMLPSSDVITLEHQYQLEAAEWAYQNAGNVAGKYIGIDTAMKIAAAGEKVRDLAGSLPVSPVTEETTLNWGQFLGNRGLEGVSDGKSPRSGNELVLKWEFNISAGTSDWAATPGTPIVAGEYTYCYIGEKLRKFRTEDGVQIASSDAPGDAMFFINIVYGDGKVFVPRYSGGRSFLAAYDADTLKYLGRSESFSLGAQCEGQTLYHDGFVYLCSYGTPATFACFRASDFQDENENIEPVWAFDTEDTDGFAANTGAAFVNGACIFATGGSEKDGTPSTVYSVDAESGRIISSFRLPGNEYVSSMPVYYEANQRIYISATGSPGCVLRSYEVRDDGSLDENTMTAYISEVENGGTQATPVIYNGRIYLGGGGQTMGSAEPFRVIDAYTMEEIYRIDEILTKGTPTLTTAYATSENHQTVYLYVVPYAPVTDPENPGNYLDSSLYIIKDSEGQTEPDYEKVSGIGSPEYCSQSVLIDQNGNLIFYNDAKGLYCYGNEKGGEYAQSDVDRQVARLPETNTFLYYNTVEIRRIRERAGNCGISGEMDRKLSEIENILSLEGEELGAYIERGLESLPEGLVKEQIPVIYNLWRLGQKKNAVLTDEARRGLSEQKAAADEWLQNGPVESVIAAVEKIPEQVSSSDEGVVLFAWNLYESLADTQQELVTNRERLFAAREELLQIQQILTEFETLLSDLYELDTVFQNREAVYQAVKILDEAKIRMREAKAVLTDADDEEAERLYAQSVASYKKNQIILWLLDHTLFPQGKVPDITADNADALIQDANLALRLYSEFSEGDRIQWNHDGDMIRIRKLLERIGQVKEREQGEKNENPEEAEETVKRTAEKGRGGGTTVSTGDETHIRQPIFCMTAALAVILAILGSTAKKRKNSEKGKN